MVNTEDGRVLSAQGYDLTPLDADRVEELARDLPPETRAILLDKGTERPFCGGLLENKKAGVYACRLCGLPLFNSQDKFESGTGWPSFFKPFQAEHIHCERDESLGMVRTEISCARCRSHMGHVFDDGPAPSGLRFCLNSAAMRFYGSDEELPPASRPIKLDTAYFAGGCFWGVEHRFQQVPGVIDAVSGYQGGGAVDPTYRAVCSGTTGHAESVRVSYDPTRVTYRRLLELFFAIHDPTQLDRQGPDIGTQYRSAVFAVDDQQMREAEAFIQEAQSGLGPGDARIVTRVEKAAPFYEAEAYHQDYHAKHGGSCSLPE